MSQRGRYPIDISEMGDLGLEPIPFSDKARPEKSRRQIRHSIHSISWRWPLVMLMFGCLVYYIVHLIDIQLPTVVSEMDVINNTRLFSGERSRKTLRKLTSLGPRVVGTPQNSIYAPAILMDELRTAQLNAHSSQSLLYEIQKGSGAYTLEFKLRLTNVYDGIQNVVAILEGSKKDHGILLNCHYDSVPTSDGASDDGISCAIMMELVRVLSKAEVRLEHNVIFLFNGAEETPLQAAHLFLKHKWAASARLVLNLEAAGLGGRAILFQSGPGNAWLFNYYAHNAPHPYGQVTGEELFQSGAIPSDTDFRIFRDFGNMPGLDFAFCRNGYVYHTIYDKEAYILPGSHQHLGDNVLGLLRGLGNAPELKDMKANAHGKMIYFDYLGWFMVRYSFEAGIAINIIVFLLSIFSVVVFIGRLSQWKWLPQGWGRVGELCSKKFKSHNSNKNDLSYAHVAQTNEGSVSYVGDNQDITALPNGSEMPKDKTRDSLSKITTHTEFVKNPRFAWIELAYAFGARVGGILAGAIFNIVMGAFIDGVAPLAMPWFSNVWLIFPLFWCPCLVGFGLVPMLMDWWRQKKRGLSLSMTAQLNLVAAQIPWALVLFVMTCSSARSAYVIMIPVLFSALANLLIHLTPLYLTVHKWMWVYLIIHTPSLLFIMYISIQGYMFFIPTMGRSGTINSDLYVACISAVLSMLTLNFAIPLLTLIRRPGVVLGLLTAFSLIMIPVSLSTSVGQPYHAGPNSPAPQRYWIMHSDRQFYNESNMLRRHDTGYFVLNLDRNSPRTIPVPGHEVFSTVKDCENELYCGLPLYLTRMVPLSHTSSWIPSGPPLIPFPTSLTIKDRLCTSSPPKCTLNFVIKGPDRLTVMFAPRKGVTLLGWSLPTPPVASEEWNGQPSYFINIVREDATTDSVLLSMEFSVTSDLTAPIVDLALAGNYVHHEDQRTLEFTNFIKKFPDWVQMTSWISSYIFYVI